MLEGIPVAVVVPAYNEARFIERTLRSIPSWVDEVVVVDDASEDDTATRAATAGDPRIRVLLHPANRGVGAAIATGYHAAFANGSGVAAVMAGDAQMDADDLHSIVAPVVRGRADYVKGDRLGFAGVRARMPFVRWVGNHVLTRLTRWATGLPVRDSQCGYTALSARAAARLPLARMWPRYGYPNDLLGALAAEGMRVHEVVVRPIYEDEDSGVRPWDALVVIPWILARSLIRRLLHAPAVPLPPDDGSECGSGS